MIRPDVHKALADPLRAQIIELLSHEQLCTCHLVEETGATQTNISNHLRVLRDAGLVADEPFGRYSYHRLISSPLAALGEAFTALAERADRAADEPERKRACS
ncbi:MAG: metalloregulator ArsR/SmtB family transcription factor [Actinomycetia bacterium]|nr:metalloregulator ArsR/SmtB family transcription factor [Actinomycetes bacterium]